MAPHVPHVPVATDEEDCREDHGGCEDSTGLTGARTITSRACRVCKVSCLVLGLLVVAMLILLGTSGPQSSGLKAWIVKASSDLSLAAESLSPPVPELGSTATAALERRGTATGLCRNGKFKNAPRIRKEWRELTKRELRAVQNAFWRLKGFSRRKSGGNAAGYAPDSNWDTTEKGIAKCKELNQGVRKRDQNPYCEYFTNYDEMAALHACSVKDPRCDQGHTGPHFMNFHRMVILKMELALMAADTNRPIQVTAIPYWDQSLDSEDPIGRYRNAPDKYIFSENYFGDFWGKPENDYAVVNGLFAEWPVAIWTEERFGSKSKLANQSKCIASEFFKGTVATADDCGDGYTATRWFRDHVECSEYVARQPNDPNGPQAYGPLGGHYGIVYSKEEFEACSTYPENVRTWMQWNTCQDPGLFFCDVPRDELLLLPVRDQLRDAIVPALKDRVTKSIKEIEKALKGGDTPSMPIEDPVETGKLLKRLTVANALAALLWTLSTNLEASADTQALLQGIANICDDPMVYGYFTKLNEERSFPRMQHGQAHFKAGRDFLDVTTSANDCGQFTQHADEDRSNMRFMLLSLRKNYRLEENWWDYPRTQFDVLSNGKPPYGLSGPFTTAGLLACQTDFDTFPFYRWLAGAWTPGTLLRDVVNSGFPFIDLFNSSCPEDEDCSGRQNGGYTNQEIMYYVHPSRTPYTYDTLAQYFDPDCELA
ncbi:unnamed protein product [Durusdinium trenchii]|uniref:Tyrosinase copper-binding domain-containing protein n=2 Tax=Durusdinium trenchii TaxID=1381693 RepID=A0ABP0KF76_9DINO